MVSFLLDSRPDKKGDHPIRLYVRSCDGYRFQSTIGYGIAPEKWDSKQQRVQPGTEASPTVNGKGILYSEINDRIDRISTAFDALTSKPGAATKAALASLLDRITSKEVTKERFRSKTTTVKNEGTESKELAIIKRFLSTCYDFSSKDRRKGYVNVYRPRWHKRQVRFWFNPPLGRNKVSKPTTNGAVYLKQDGTIFVEQSPGLMKPSYYTGKIYNLNDCLGPSLANFAASVESFWFEERCFKRDDYSPEDIVSSFVIPDGVPAIASHTFDGCTELKAVSIPESVTEIGDSAFEGCIGLTEICLPESVTSIGSRAFYGCAGLKRVYLPNANIIGVSSFSNCVGLTEFRIPDTVTKIGSFAFMGCSRLKVINLPKSMTEIEAGVFEGCTELTEISIPDSVTSIGYDAFKGCAGLTKIRIPDSMTRIGTGAFEGCTGLKEINIPDSVKNALAKKM